MSVFPTPVGPRAALHDLRAFMRQRSREQVIGAALAVLVTAIIVIEFLVDPYTQSKPPPQVIYVQSWSANRTTAQIIADQKKDQQEKRAEQLEKQHEFQKLAKDFGIK
jgi:hypothetical protein